MLWCNRGIILTFILPCPVVGVRCCRAFTGHTQVRSSLLDSNIDPSNRGDLLEAFGVGWKLLVLENDEMSGNNDRHKAGTNIWPLEPAGFREVYHNY